MNLCLAYRDVPEVHGGLARATRDLAVALAQHGHSVQLLTDSASDLESGLPGVAIRPVHPPRMAGRLRDARAESAPGNLLHAAAVYREVSRIHEEEEPVDAVLAPLWRSEAAVCLLDDRFPTIVSCMTSLKTMTEIDDAIDIGPEVSERLALEHETLRRSRYLHGLTEAALRKTIDDYGLTPALTAVIRRGLLDRSDPETNGGTTNGTVEILFVGRLERRKGVDTLLAAARKLAGDGAAARFTLVGPAVDPGYRDSIERQLEEPPRLNGIVRFAGAVPDPELHRLYSHSDIVCVPSRYESHGIVPVEAMMFGKPIVTCDAGGIGEVVDAEANGLLCPPDDPDALAHALRRLVNDAKLRSRLGRTGREMFERRFDAQTVAGPMLTYVERVVAAHEPNPSDVPGRLQQLVADVFGVPASEAAELAGDLLDPAEAARHRHAEDAALLAQAQEEIERLRRAVSAQEETLAFLHKRHVTLTRVEEGGWWKLRSRLLPLLRIASRLRSAWIHTAGRRR